MSIHKGELLNLELLKAAVQSDNIRMTMFIQSGACPNAVDNEGKTALHHAAKTGNIHILDQLIEAGANVDQGIIHNDGTEPFMTHITPAEIAGWNSHFNFLERLAAYGADLEAPDELANSFLMRSISYGKNLLADKLIQLGADVNAQNYNGYTPLHVSVEQANRELTKILIQNGAKNSPDNQGVTPIHLGEKNGLDILITKVKKDIISRRTMKILNQLFTTEDGKDAFEVTVIPKKNRT